MVKFSKIIQTQGIILEFLCNILPFTNTKKYVKILTETKSNHKYKLTKKEFLKMI